MRRYTAIWRPEAREPFQVNFGLDLPTGVTLTSATIWLEERTATDPETWSDISSSVTIGTPAIVNHTTKGTEYTLAAVNWTAGREEDGDPVPGGVFRWKVRAVGTDGLDYPARIRVEIEP